jgi:hypothetical protein
MKKIRNFIREYREHGEADGTFVISLWHIIIPVALITLAIIIFK